MIVSKATLGWMGISYTHIFGSLGLLGRDLLLGVMSGLDGASLDSSSCQRATSNGQGNNGSQGPSEQEPEGDNL